MKSLLKEQDIRYLLKQQERLDIEVIGNVFEHPELLEVVE